MRAKKSGSVEGKVIAYSADGGVIGKAEDSINLTEGKTNYFEYHFNTDSEIARMEQSVKSEKSFFKGDDNAVEVVDTNLSGDHLYITFKQVKDNLNTFAKFKILFYKGEQLVDTESGHYSIYADGLDGKDTTDIAEIWVYGTDFDKFEIILED